MKTQFRKLLVIPLFIFPLQGMAIEPLTATVIAVAGIGTALGVEEFTDDIKDTVDRAERAGDRLLEKGDRIMEDRINQIDGVIDDSISQLNDLQEATLAEVRDILEDALVEVKEIEKSVNDHLLKILEKAECIPVELFRTELVTTCGEGLFCRLLGFNRIEIHSPSRDKSKKLRIKQPYDITVREVESYYLNELNNHADDETPLINIISAYRHLSVLAKKAQCSMPPDALSDLISMENNYEKQASLLLKIRDI